MEKNLRRSADKMVSGVAAGLAEYINVDPVLIRLVMVLFGLSHLGLAVLVYVVLAVVMPAPLEVAGKVQPFDDEEIIIKDA